MAAVSDTIRPVLHRARLRLKGFAYSGFARDRWQRPEQVVTALGVGEGDRVADLGAGAGYFTFRLGRAVGPDGRVYAVDTDADMSELIEHTAAVERVSNVVTVAAADEDPALPEGVDLVLTVNAFHHLPEPAEYFATAAKYLRPGGRVAIIEALPRWFLFGHATQPETIAAAMAGAGYALAERHDFLDRQSFQVFTRAD
jgi:ubiquinone/menaquinone biosynthesis C-methylase UbiE